MTPPNPDRAEIVEKLRSQAKWLEPEFDLLDESVVLTAADLIEQDAKQIEELDRTASDLQALCDQQALRIAKLSEALDGATKVIEGYVGFLHRLPACDLELHPYIPGVEDALDAAREALTDIPPESQDIR